MLLGDNEGALEAFAWFEQEFDDDVGTPDHSLCWSLALYRAGNEIGAAKKLRQAVLANLYLVPRLLREPISEIDMWHGSSDAEPDYVDHVPDPYLQLWTDEEKRGPNGSTTALDSDRPVNGTSRSASFWTTCGRDRRGAVWSGRCTSWNADSQA